jgi:hypothetical protein
MNPHMNRDIPKLHDEDRRAVDLLLDHASQDLHGHGQVKPAPLTASVPPPRLTAARRTLALLDAMPELEPPADLVARTLARVERAGRAGRAGHRPVKPAAHVPPPPPHA